jgi:hypothetical protein
MIEQEIFFTRNQERLLSIASWAKSLAWVVLAIFAVGAFSEFFKSQYIYAYQFQQQAVFRDILVEQPLYALNTIANVTGVLLKGIIYYLLLKSISLGLNMIVETDINYREQKENGGEL